MKREGGADEPTASFPSANGRMARRVREFDWSATPLGPSANWALELRTALNIILDSKFPAALVWGPGLVTIYNDAFRPILGNKQDTLGRSFADIWSEAWDDISPLMAQAFAGEAVYIEDLPLLVNRFGAVEQAWFTFCYSPVRLIDGTVGGVMDTVIETTQSVRARAQLDVLTQELRHRLKNTLATVQALARRSLRDVDDREAVEGFLDRIVAMGAAHDVLFTKGSSAPLVEEVVDATLPPLKRQDRIERRGPPLRIGPQATVALSLLLHELAINALKHGALSAPEGHITLTWEIDGEMFRLNWRESRGPPVRAPSRRGFGTRLIDMGLGDRSTVTRNYSPTGLEVCIVAPIVEMR